MYVIECVLDYSRPINLTQFPGNEFNCFSAKWLRQIHNTTVLGLLVKLEQNKKQHKCSSGTIFSLFLASENAIRYIQLDTVSTFTRDFSSFENSILF